MRNSIQGTGLVCTPYIPMEITAVFKGATVLFLDDKYPSNTCDRGETWTFQIILKVYLKKLL